MVAGREAQGRGRLSTMPMDTSWALERQGAREKIRLLSGEGGPLNVFLQNEL